MFATADGDEVLLCPAPADALRAHLVALHGGEHAPVTWMVLPEQGHELVAYARAHPPAPPVAAPLPSGLRRHTAVLAADGGLEPLFQSVAPARDGARLEASDLPDVLPRLQAWTRLDQAPALHLSLSLTALLSPAFTRFVSAAGEAGLAGRLGASVPLLAAVADLHAWAEAAAVARADKVAVAVDGVSHAALALVDPAALGPDLVRVSWSPEMIEGGPRLLAALRVIDPGRIVLEKADTETALRWGLSRGIRRFGGRHVDVMQAGMRMKACLAAAACTVRQCADRAAATSPAGRAGCRNPAHLSTASGSDARAAA